MSANDKFGLGYGDHRYDGILSYENEVLQSVFMNKESEIENQPLYDRFVTAEGMHVVPPPMTGNYMPSGPEIEVDYSQFTYGPKQTQPSESESQSSEFDTCMSACCFIEEYESDSEDEYVSIPTKQQETPSFANQQVKTPRENVKSQFTHSQKPKVDKKDLGYGFTVRACFVCGSLNHLIRDCDFHEKRMARKAELNNGWNNVQRVNKQNQFVPSAVLTRTGIIPVNTAKASSTKNFSTARQSFNRQTVLTSTAMKVNTVKPIVNRVRPANVFYKTHSPSSRPFKKTTVLRTKFSNQKLNTAKVNAVSTVGGQRETAVKSSAGCNWRPQRNNWHNFSKYNSGSNLRKCYTFKDPIGRLKPKQAWGNTKTVKLDFEDACFVKELQHFNLFSVSQICDKKNKVMFTDSEWDWLFNSKGTTDESNKFGIGDSFLHNTFWAEAVSTACYVLNRVLVTKPHNKTPYELLTDDKLEKKTIFHTVAKIEFVTPKQQEKPVSKPVKYAEMYWSQSPRGNQRNWNNQKLTAITIKENGWYLGIIIKGLITIIRLKAHPSAHRNMVPRAVLMKTDLRSLNTARPVNTAHPKTMIYKSWLPKQMTQALLPKLDSDEVAKALLLPHDRCTRNTIGAGDRKRGSALKFRMSIKSSTGLGIVHFSSFMNEGIALTRRTLNLPPPRFSRAKREIMGLYEIRLCWEEILSRRRDIKMEDEMRNIRKGTHDIAAYKQPIQRIVLLCPKVVPSIRMAHGLMEQKVQGWKEKNAEQNKRKWEGGNQGSNQGNRVIKPGIQPVTTTVTIENKNYRSEWRFMAHYSSSRCKCESRGQPAPNCNSVQQCSILEIVPGEMQINVEKGDILLTPSEMKELSEQLKELLEKDHSARASHLGDLALWKLPLSEIRYHLGKANVVADALSRKVREKPLRVRSLVMSTYTDLSERILKAQLEAVKQENVKAENLGRLLKPIFKIHSTGFALRVAKVTSSIIDLQTSAATMKFMNGSGTYYYDFVTGPSETSSDRDSHFRLGFEVTSKRLRDRTLNNSTAYSPEELWSKVRELTNSEDAVSVAASPVCWNEVGDSQLTGTELIRETTKSHSNYEPFAHMLEAEQKRSENQANLHAGQQEANPNAGTEDIIDARDSEIEDESAQDCFVRPIWPSYSLKITPVVQTDDKREGPREEEQVFMDELERLKRQEKEANEEAELYRKKFEQENRELSYTSRSC
ncbi:ribonuclease H-like domain-containing protein [Tanacetum coccineum]|uniref:Ribonuclease H-like domain-containing protein n=1 Tax=Tanacetum coccineum TaxID=301880 RepID=A0ABQ5B7Q9_9ASTR